MLPAVGTRVEVVIDHSFVHAYMEPAARHRSPAQLTIRGTVVEPAKWMSSYMAILNSETGVTCYLTSSQIISVNDVRVEQAVPSEDRVVIIRSDRTGEAYTVQQNGVTKKWTCSCVGWQFKHKCKHVLQAQKA